MTPEEIEAYRQDHGGAEPEGQLRTTKAQRTGCQMCGFGIHLEHRPHRFDRIRYKNPKEWEMWMNHICQDETGAWYGWGLVLDYIGVGWKDDIFSQEDPKMLCEECAAALQKDFTMEQPEGAEDMTIKRGSCWSCGRKRRLAPYYATGEVPQE